jgi:superfamily II DNA or RNA helicase
MVRRKKGSRGSDEIEDFEWLRDAYADVLDLNIRLADENVELRQMNVQLMNEMARLREDIKVLRPFPIPQQSVPMDVPPQVHSTTPIPPQKVFSTSVPSQIRPNATGIEVFRALFRGRDDVYAKRWENLQKATSGYTPACAKEWKRPHCTKPQKKCTECVYSPMTHDVITSHLAGYLTVGVYPMLSDDTCWFLAADFDGDEWQRDATAYLKTCQDLKVPAYLERSRSGNGGHIWIFFEMPMLASIARKLGAAILTKAMEDCHEIKFTTYDRFFPNQDTMPRGGFGNLIALPLQGKSARVGNAVFLDEKLNPYEDQWGFLQSIQRMPPEQVEILVDTAERDGTVIGLPLSMADEEKSDPWTATPSKTKREKRISGVLPESIKIVQSNMLYLEKSGISSQFLNRLKRLAAFQNPEFYKNQALRMPNYKTPRVIGCARDFDRHIGLPRGILSAVQDLLTEHKIGLELIDERYKGKSLPVHFKGELREDQKQAVAELIKHDIGILSATTAFGKTVVGAWLIAERKVNTLVLVHRGELLEQWRDRLSTFLGIEAKAIGQIGSGKTKPNGFIDIGMVQSLSNKDGVKNIVAEYGQVIVDECHHVAAFSIESILSQVKARYITGLTATPTRKDGHHPIIIMQCGPIRYRVSAKQQAKERPFNHVVRPRRTMVQQSLVDMKYQDLCEILISDSARNDFIVADIVQAIGEGRSPLVLTERREHLDTLAALLTGKVDHLITMYGGRTKKERDACIEHLRAVPHSESRILIATGKYIGEGFDDPRLDTLFLTLPISWKGTLQQYAGRLHRLYEGKLEVRVYDYVDSELGMAVAMFEKRKKGYRAIGYEIDPLR